MHAKKPLSQQSRHVSVPVFFSFNEDRFTAASKAVVAPHPPSPAVTLSSPQPTRHGVPLLDALVPTGLGPVEMPTDPDIKSVVTGLLNASKTPTEKYSQPQTSSHEVGWFHKPLVPSNPRFMHGLKAGEATEFAETYTKKMAGEHMFHGKSGRYLKY